MYSERSLQIAHHGGIKRPYAWFMFCVPIIVFIFLARDFNALFKPVLELEDGSQMFGYYYNFDGLGSLLRWYLGYLSLLPNILGYLCSLFPTIWWPHLLVLLSIIIFWIAFSTFCLPLFRPYVINDFQRALICVALAAIPLGNYAMVLASYTLWPAGIILCLLSISEIDTSVKNVRSAAVLVTFRRKNREPVPLD
jgi:hypothetical protein